jgi:molybdopterin synthase catalytic subunit
VSVRVGPRQLSLSAAARELEDPACGAVVLFVGRVRPDRTARGRVAGLFYEADRELAVRSLHALELGARRKFGAARIVLWHRTGELGVGTPSVIVGVATAHRAEAFAAARFLIEQLKAKAPIWKTDRWRSGHRRPPRRARRAAP